MWGSFHCKEQNPLKLAQVRERVCGTRDTFLQDNGDPKTQPQEGQGQGRLQGSHALVDSLRCPL